MPRLPAVREIHYGVCRVACFTDLMTTSDEPGSYGERWAEVYDDEHAFLDPSDAVAFLSELAGGRPALELGIGTGRVALPLHAAGVDIRGVDASPAMVERLRAKIGRASCRERV